MNSKIYWGSTHHARLTPDRHIFNYPLYCVAFDISELESLGSSGRIFGYNRAALFSIYDRDYLTDESGSIFQKLSKVLAQNGLSLSNSKCTLITVPRFIGYIFNPVSFYIAQDSSGQVQAILAEVNNTFGEKHLYVMRSPNPSALPVSFSFPKEFFVSPFFDVSGEYTVTLLEFGEKLNFRIELKREGVLTFFADLTGQAMAFTTRFLLSTLVRYPLAALLTMARIETQALRLHFSKGLIPFRKPAPVSQNTVRAHPNWVHKLKISILDLVRTRAGKPGTH